MSGISEKKKGWNKMFKKLTARLRHPNAMG